MYCSGCYNRHDPGSCPYRWSVVNREPRKIREDDDE